MERPWDLLPELLLDKLLRAILATCPFLQAELLSSFGSRVHFSAVRVLFTCLKIEDDCLLFDCAERFRRSKIYPLITNRGRYAHIVRSLTITNPANLGIQDSSDNTPVQASHPLSADQYSRLLQCCCNLEDFRWESSLRPPDGICEQLSIFNPRLRRFQYNPCQPKFTSQCVHLVKWDAPSLPLLSTLPITTLSLSALSQTGTRAFARLLNIAREDSVLENLDVDLIWLEENICKAIAEAGRKIRSLRICTNGTKLNDNGLISIMETCESVEELILTKVQGRISRSMWTKPTTFPPALRSLRIDISETGPNHSWAIDHLDSLHAFPLEQLTEISILRRPGLPTIQNATVIHDNRVDSVVALKRLPPTISERLRGCKLLTKFCCDFWSISISDLKYLLEICPKLESLQISLDAPFAKLLGLASTFATLSRLRTISVSVKFEHAPGTPPPFILPNALSLATEAPIVNRKSISPQLLNINQTQTQICLEKDPSDPSFPLLREVKRFVRKCPNLELLDWYGKFGRGSWIVKRPIHNSKNSVNVSVDYVPPSLSMETWEEIRREARVKSFFVQNPPWLYEVRPGQDWTGEQAELMAADPSECKDAGVETARRTETRKPRVSLISTSSSSTSDMNMPSTPSRTSVSPVDVQAPFSSPLGSPASLRFQYRNWDADTSSPARVHKRSPSEPIISRQRSEKNSIESSPSNFGFGRRSRGRGRGRGRGLRKTSMEEGQNSGPDRPLCRK